MARASAAEIGKGPAKKRGAKRGADDALSLAELLARCTRADLEALLLEHQDDLPDLQAAVEAKLQPEQVRGRKRRKRAARCRGRRAISARAAPRGNGRERAGRLDLRDAHTRASSARPGVRAAQPLSAGDSFRFGL